MIQENSEIQSSLFEGEQFPQEQKVRKGRAKKSGVRRQNSSVELGLKAPSTIAKNFVLDTNVLLHDPGCLQRFAENHVCIPVDVLAELDRFKNEQSERGANARAVHRALSALFSAGGEGVMRGVPSQGGGSIRLVVFDPRGNGSKESAELERFFRVFPDRERVDHRILACVLLVQAANRSPVCLVTKDLNMQLKARAVGIVCEDYLSDKVDAREVSSYDFRRVEALPTDLQRLASSGSLQFDDGRLDGVGVNEYVLLCASEKHTLPARLDAGGELRCLHLPEAIRIPHGQTIRPLNLGQQCFLDAMLNPEIDLVTCYGQAGTGKTLLAVALGLSEVLNHRYVGLTISRPVVAMGDTVGFLPGTLEEKMHPWLQPIYDALELVLRPEGRPVGGPTRKRGKHAENKQSDGGRGFSAVGSKIYDPLLQQGLVEIEALCYIRGRSIPNRFFILDEAQQITPLEAKTIITRMSRGSKLIMVGDPAQIDNPYVDSRSNGLVHARKKMQGQAFAAHVTLCKGERSDLAEAGAQLM